ncbi:MAG: VWA domain-containing protein [Pseudoruegeria sp.]
MYEFLFPLAFIALPAPLLVWWLTPPRRERVAALRVPFFDQIAAAAGAEPHAGSVVLRRSTRQFVGACLIWGLCIGAMARPVILGTPIEDSNAARDVILAIDISGSMDARDMPGADGSPQQRLDTVKQVVGNFITERKGDRVALIVFGSKAFLQAPLTEDLTTVHDLLDQTTVGMAGPHTAIGDAIGLSIRTFENSEIEQRLLILLSDGTDTNSRMSPVNAAEIARDSGVVIHSVAVGDPNATGENKVDLKTLQDIANRTGGDSFYAGDAETLTQIYAKIDELTPRETETLTYRPREPLSGLLLGIALMIGFLILAPTVLRSAKRGRL